MPFFIITRKFNQESLAPMPIMKCEKLEEGERNIFRNGVNLPVLIEGDKITIHVSQVSGTGLDKMQVYPLGDEVYLREILENGAVDVSFRLKQPINDFAIVDLLEDGPNHPTFLEFFPSNTEPT